ncbi:hypothetical protein ABFY41_05760 [Acinetobacter haemolyticus]|uniref:Glycosyltransferase n=1 Tax=Acinetobacter haemolyticus TaxID=29430 RepID=A0AAW4J6S8_ACIHA|nr:glycosyltransferase family 4 protein [Acinetobacter haemolyticus]MBO3658607.1 hypothetical protein [Acinetobacter haemolyticus]NAR50007.1 hypothetical protein [Acinetobacter haemolyticus]
MSFKYFLLTKNFFMEGPCGRVSHAKGFVEGLACNHKDVTLISGKGAGDFIEESAYINFRILKNFFVLNFIYEIIKSICNNDVVVIRWRPFIPFLILPFLLFYKKIYFELNSITGLDSKNPIIKVIVKLSIVIISRFSKIIVVSENSKNQILSIVNSKNPIYVMPNGFNPKAFENFSPNINSNYGPNLIYFGKKQDYYEWDNLYQVLSENPSVNLHVFGFDDHIVAKNINFYGKFNHESLVEKINLIINPILIIHPDDSEIARSGSPMKLFEYAYLNIPVIVGDSLSQIGKDFNEFIFYKSGDYESLNSTILNVCEEYSILLKESAALRGKVESNYSWNSIVGRWLDHEFRN